MDDGLDVKCQAFRGPVATHVVLPHRRTNVGFERLCVRADGPSAGGAYFGVGAVGLLNDGAGKTGKVGQVTHQNSLAKIDIGDEPVERIGGVVIGSRSK